METLTCSSALDRLVGTQRFNVLQSAYCVYAGKISVRTKILMQPLGTSIASPSKTSRSLAVKNSFQIPALGGLLTTPIVAVQGKVELPGSTPVQ